MSTTSKKDNKANGVPEKSEETTTDEVVPAQVDGPELNGNSSKSPEESGSSAVSHEASATDTVVDPPWAAAVEPSDSVFADRAPGAGNGRPEAFEATPVHEDKPVASAAGSLASAAGSLSAKFGRSSTDEDGKPARKAHLQVSRFEPWSVMKFSFVMSLVCFVVLFVAVTVLYMILSGLGVFDSITEAINETTRSPGSSGTDAASWFSAGRILGYTALVGALNVLLITALATVGSVIYNLAADFVGGVEVTLKEAE